MHAVLTSSLHEAHIFVVFCYGEPGEASSIFSGFSDNYAVQIIIIIVIFSQLCSAAAVPVMCLCRVVDSVRFWSLLIFFLIITNHLR